MALNVPKYPDNASTNMGYKLGLSELLPDIISPVDAPVYKTAKRAPADAIEVKWQYDSLASTTGSTFTLPFASDATFSTTVTRVEAANLIERFVAPWKLLEVAELVAKRKGVAGVSSEVEYEVKKQWNRLTISIEKRLTGNNDAVLDDGSTQAAEMSGYFSNDATYPAIGAITTNLIDNSAGADVDIDEDDLNTMADTLFTGGSGKELDAYASVTLISHWNKTFQGLPYARAVAPASDTQIKAYRNSILTRCGSIIRFNPNRSMVTNGGIIIADMAHITVYELLPPTVTRVMPEAGSNHHKGSISTYITLGWDNPNRHGGWLGASTPTS